MDNNFGNIPEENAQNVTEETVADVNQKPENEQPQISESQKFGNEQPQMNESQKYEYGQTAENPQPNYQQQYQDNYNYNVGSNTEYHQTYDRMDTSPMSMGDWLLTLLAMMIPCAGIVLYFVWAFGKSGNINRRNFCRAQLIITGAVLVLYMILILIFGIAAIGSSALY